MLICSATPQLRHTHAYIADVEPVRLHDTVSGLWLCEKVSVEDLTTFPYTHHLEDVTYPSMYARNHEDITTGLAWR